MCMQGGMVGARVWCTGRGTGLGTGPCPCTLHTAPPETLSRPGTLISGKWLGHGPGVRKGCISDISGQNPPKTRVKYRILA